MTNAIELNHISKSFGEFSLKDVTLAIPAGTICGLVGENGAGKSTLIRILMGALRPDSGTAAALGVDVSAPDFLDAKEDIGVVLDEGCFPETLTAPQVGRVMAATYRRWEQDTFDAYCRRFALPEKTAFKDYSRGMKMKLTIAVALSHQAQLLVLDEATAGLDPVVRDSILMPGTVVKSGAVIEYAIVAENVTVEEGAHIGRRPEEMTDKDSWGVTVLADGVHIAPGCTIGARQRIEADVGQPAGQEV